MGWNEFLAGLKKAGDWYQGASEGVTSAATGLAAAPVAGWAGLTNMMRTGDLQSAGNAMEESARALTYEPQTPEGQAVAGVIQAPLEGLNAATDWAGQKVEQGANAVGLESAAPWLGAAAKTAADWYLPIGIAKGAKAMRGAMRPPSSAGLFRDMASQASREAAGEARMADWEGARQPPGGPPKVGVKQLDPEKLPAPTNTRVAAPEERKAYLSPKEAAKAVATERRGKVFSQAELKAEFDRWFEEKLASGEDISWPEVQARGTAAGAFTKRKHWNPLEEGGGERGEPFGAFMDEEPAIPSGAEPWDNRPDRIGAAIDRYAQTRHSAAAKKNLARLEEFDKWQKFPVGPPADEPAGLLPPHPERKMLPPGEVDWNGDLIPNNLPSSDRRIWSGPPDHPSMAPGGQQYMSPSGEHVRAIPRYLPKEWVNQGRVFSGPPDHPSGYFEVDGRGERYLDLRGRLREQVKPPDLMGRTEPPPPKAHEYPRPHNPSPAPSPDPWKGVASEAAKRAEEQGGFTVRVGDQGSPWPDPFPNKGIVYVPEKGHEQILSHAPRPQEIRDFAAQHKNSINREYVNGPPTARPTVGDWKSAGGRHHMEVGRLDIGQDFNGSAINRILEEARKAEQQAVYDLGAKQEIPVPPANPPRSPHEPGQYIQIGDLYSGEALKTSPRGNVYRNIGGGRFRMEERPLDTGGVQHFGTNNWVQEGESSAINHHHGVVGTLYGEPAAAEAAKPLTGDVTAYARLDPVKVKLPPDKPAKKVTRALRDLEPGQELNKGNGTVWRREEGDRIRLMKNAGGETPHHKAGPKKGKPVLEGESSDVMHHLRTGEVKIPGEKGKGQIEWDVRETRNDPAKKVREARQQVRRQGGNPEPTEAENVNALEREALQDLVAPGQRDFFKHPEWEMPASDFNIDAYPSEAQGKFRGNPEGWMGVPRNERASYNQTIRAPDRMVEGKEIIRQQGGRVKGEAAQKLADAVEQKNLDLHPSQRPLEEREVNLGPNPGGEQATAYRDLPPRWESIEGQENLPFVTDLKREVVREGLERNRSYPYRRDNLSVTDFKLEPGAEMPPKAESVRPGMTPRDIRMTREAAGQQKFGDNGQPFPRQKKEALPPNPRLEEVKKRELARPQEERKRLFKVQGLGDSAAWEALPTREGGPDAPPKYAGKGHVRNSEGTQLGKSLKGPLGDDEAAATRRFNRQYGREPSAIEKILDPDNYAAGSGDVDTIADLKRADLEKRHPSRVPKVPKGRVKVGGPGMWRGNWDFSTAEATEHMRQIERFPDVTDGTIPGVGKEIFNKVLEARRTGGDAVIDAGAAAAIEKADMAGTGMINRQDPRYPIGQVRLFGQRGHENFYANSVGGFGDGHWRAGPPGWEFGYVDKGGNFYSRKRFEAIAGNEASENNPGWLGTTKRTPSQQAAFDAEVEQAKADKARVAEAARKAEEEANAQRRANRVAAAKEAYEKDQADKAKARTKEYARDRANRRGMADDEQEVMRKATNTIQERKRMGWTAEAERDAAERLRAEAGVPEAEPFEVPGLSPEALDALREEALREVVGKWNPNEGPLGLARPRNPRKAAHREILERAGVNRRDLTPADPEELQSWGHLTGTENRPAWMDFLDRMPDSKAKTGTVQPYPADYWTKDVDVPEPYADTPKAKKATPRTKVKKYGSKSGGSGGSQMR